MRSGSGAPRSASATLSMRMVVVVMVVVGVDGPMIMVMRMAIVAPAVALLGGVVRVVVTASVVMGLRAGLSLHIGAALGIERRLERDHPSPEPLGHPLDDGIAADAQLLRQHFGQEVAVAKVPGDAG